MQKATYDLSHVELLEINLAPFWTLPNRHAGHRENYPLLDFPELKMVIIVTIKYLGTGCLKTQHFDWNMSSII